MDDTLLNIAIIDDDPVYRFVAKNMLEKIKGIHHMYFYEDAESAIEDWISSLEPAPLPDIILVDINMNALDGWDLLDQLHERLPQRTNSRIYMVSSSPLDSDVEQAKNHPIGIQGYIVKPIGMQKLNAVISHDGVDFLEVAD
ncbi:MAG: response regulator [Bacteroidetes bacterium]|nr:MAG: response regulator [Bacteroidota bacterium]